MPLSLRPHGAQRWPHFTRPTEFCDLIPNSPISERASVKGVVLRYNLPRETPPVQRAGRCVAGAVHGHNLGMDLEFDSYYGDNGGGYYLVTNLSPLKLILAPTPGSHGHARR